MPALISRYVPKFNDGDDVSLFTTGGHYVVLETRVPRGDVDQCSYKLLNSVANTEVDGWVVESALIPYTWEDFNLSYSDALRFAKAGSLMARKGWNGKGMFIYYVRGSTFEVNRAPLNRIFPEGHILEYLPHMDMKTADNKCVPWLCSQTDMDAEDWGIVRK